MTCRVRTTGNRVTAYTRTRVRIPDSPHETPCRASARSFCLPRYRAPGVGDTGQRAPLASTAVFPIRAVTAASLPCLKPTFSACTVSRQGTHGYLPRPTHPVDLRSVIVKTRCTPQPYRHPSVHQGLHIALRIPKSNKSQRYAGLDGHTGDGTSWQGKPWSSYPSSGAHCLHSITVEDTHVCSPSRMANTACFSGYRQQSLLP